MTMFTKQELEENLDFIDRKINDILTNGKGSDLDYIRKLQALAKMKDTAIKKLDEEKTRVIALSECKKERE